MKKLFRMENIFFSFSFWHKWIHYDFTDSLIFFKQLKWISSLQLKSFHIKNPLTRHTSDMWWNINSPTKFSTNQTLPNKSLYAKLCNLIRFRSQNRAEEIKSKSFSNKWHFSFARCKTFPFYVHNNSTSKSKSCRKLILFH